MSFLSAERKSEENGNKCKGKRERGEESIHEGRSIGPERKIRTNEFRDITLTKALFLGTSFFSLREEKVERRPPLVWSSFEPRPGNLPHDAISTRMRSPFPLLATNFHPLPFLRCHTEGDKTGWGIRPTNRQDPLKIRGNLEARI